MLPEISDKRCHDTSSFEAGEKILEASEAVSSAVFEMFIQGDLSQPNLTKIYRSLSEWTDLGVQIIESMTTAEHNSSGDNT